VLETVETETLSSFICLRVALTFIIKVCVDFISNLLEMHLTLLNIWFSLLADSLFRLIAIYRYFAI
jgi:hypothetical protein